MESIYYDAEITIALINNGMSSHQKNSAGETVLHRCAALGYYHQRLIGDELLSVLQLLLEKGADRRNFTPIIAAVTCFNWTALDFILDTDGIDRMEKVDAMEMAFVEEVHNLTSYPNDPEYQRIFGYWHRALRLRPKVAPNIPLTLKSERAGEWATERNWNARSEILQTIIFRCTSPN